METLFCAALGSLLLASCHVVLQGISCKSHDTIKSMTQNMLSSVGHILMSIWGLGKLGKWVKVGARYPSDLHPFQALRSSTHCCNAH